MQSCSSVSRATHRGTDRGFEVVDKISVITGIPSIQEDYGTNGGGAVWSITFREKFQGIY